MYSFISFYSLCFDIIELGLGLQSMKRKDATTRPGWPPVSATNQFYLFYATQLPFRAVVVDRDYVWIAYLCLDTLVRVPGCCLVTHLVAIRAHSLTDVVR